MKRRVTLERTYAAPIAMVWELWTTKEGIESWWGPHGFRVEVHSIDLRVGGELHYSMIAAAPEMVEFMKKNGMKPETRHKITFREIVPHERLAYLQLADFIPEVAPYDVDTVVEMQETAGGAVKMTLTFDAMHDEMWTERATQGWNMELDKLAKKLESAEMKIKHDKITPFLWYERDAEAAGRRFLALNGGPHYKATPAYSMFGRCDDQREVDRLWKKLLAGGGTDDRCGWLRDKFGLSWQILPVRLLELLSHRDREVASRATQAMLEMKKIDVKRLERAAGEARRSS